MKMRAKRIDEKQVNVDDVYSERLGRLSDADKTL
jgi:hypothetical protein